jgi:hypothetical protein
MAASPSASMRAQLGSSTQLSSWACHANLGARQVLAKPGPQLLDEHVGVVEQAVDEIDRPLAIELSRQAAASCFPMTSVVAPRGSICTGSCSAH